MKQTAREWSGFISGSCIEESIVGIKQHSTQRIITISVHLASLRQVHLATKPL